MLNKFLIKILKTKFKEIIQYFSMDIELFKIAKINHIKKVVYKIKVIKRVCIFSVFLGGKSLVFQDFCSEKTDFSGYCGSLVINIAIVFISWIQALLF